MLRFILTRASLVIPTFLGVTLLTFALIRLAPGDPVLLMAGERGIDPVRYAMLRGELHLDDPLLVQYGYYMADVLRGDLGKSIITREPVFREFITLFPATIELSVMALLFAVILGLPAGIFAAVRRGSIFDHTLMGISLTGYSMPIFWWGILAILLFSVTLGWTPVSGRISAMYFIDPVTGFLLLDSWLAGDNKAFVSALRHLILPAIVLGTVPLAIIARMTRSSMLEVLNEDYIRTARAKGLPPHWVVGVHALRNALIPGHHGDRPAGRPAADRRHPDRDGVLLAGHRQMADRIHPPARLPGPAGRRAARGLHRHGRESDRRRALRPDQPADPPWPLGSTPSLSR